MYISMYITIIICGWCQSICSKLRWKKTGVSIVFSEYSKLLVGSVPTHVWRAIMCTLVKITESTYAIQCCHILEPRTYILYIAATQKWLIQPILLYTFFFNGYWIFLKKLREITSSVHANVSSILKYNKGRALSWCELRSGLPVYATNSVCYEVDN